MASPSSRVRRFSLSALYTYTLYLFSCHSSLGRYKLAQLLHISDSYARSLVQKLVSLGFLEKSNQRLGHQLSSFGLDFWSKFSSYILIPSSRIYLGRYTVGSKDAAVCVEAGGIERLSTVVLRDESLLNGALGCTVFLKKGSKIFLLDSLYPPLPRKVFSDRKVSKKLLRLVSDVDWSTVIIIVGTANDVLTAQLGALAASLLLLPADFKRVHPFFD
ncbi:MAG: DUF4443 domain-containing protein [Candidatus Hodarchaeales archaeon]